MKGWILNLLLKKGSHSLGRRIRRAFVKNRIKSTELTNDGQSPTQVDEEFRQTHNQAKEEEGARIELAKQGHSEARRQHRSPQDIRQVHMLLRIHAAWRAAKCTIALRMKSRKDPHRSYSTAMALPEKASFARIETMEVLCKS